MNTSAASPTSAPLQLFVRHLTGQLADGAWTQFVNAYDTVDASPAERIAYAAFLNDAVCDLGPDAVPVPKPEEVDDVLTCTRWGRDVV